MLKVLTRPEPTYDGDFTGWAWRQAELLRNGRFSELDLTNLIDEVSALPQSDWNAIESNLRIVLLHMLKWRFQPGKRKGGWAASIREHRRRVSRLLRKNPSFAPSMPETLIDAYRVAHIDASEETGLAYEIFPEDCPFTLDQALDADFLPDAVEEA